MKLELVTVRPNLNKKGQHTLHRGAGVRGGVVCYRSKSLMLFKEFYLEKNAIKKIRKGAHKYPCAGITGMPLPNMMIPKEMILLPITLNFKILNFQCDEDLVLSDLIYVEGHRFYKVHNFRK